jgi:O-antigen ligase
MADNCYDNDSEPGAEYRCEKVGLFGTYSIEDRVRYRGELHDPNELSMTICIGGLSLLVAFMRRKRTPAWTAFGVLGVSMILWCVTMSGSRGGLLVFMIVLAAFFIDRFRWPGVVIGAVASVPLALLALGGRSGEAADMSTQLRYEAWSAGLEMFKRSPLVGVGHRLFGENHYMTAHNSYVLTLAELGFPGFFLFVSLLYLSVKMLWAGVTELEHLPAAQPARDWGLALLASFAAMIFQISTLSFAYHSVLWIMLGLAAGWWSAVRVHKPDFEVRLTGRDLFFIAVGCGLFVVIFLPVLLRLKGA